MLRDPFYRQILQAFEGHLDPQVFERCMGGLLRPDFPGLVPVPGGRDSGFDGVIPDEKGAFPLVCTTAEKVERNLAMSLDSVVKRGWPARRVALATSQALTPPRRLGLFDKAQEKGFRMMQVLDRSALADRLYRSSRWCKELLHLDGRPSPLSVVPLTQRPLIDLEPIGRQKDLDWLEGTGEDRVLAGEPGSGKTHLLRYLMLFRSWPALFLVSRDFDAGAIRNAIGDLEPRVVVVDDAHGNPSDLVRLVQLRRETGASFHVVATTWKGMQDEVVAKLGVSPAQVRRLELLTRDEIVQVFREVGVRTDNDRLRLLVNQAANRPGLAVTIASLWLQDRWNELIDGTALSRDLLTFFHEFVGSESTDVLAAFSLGGDRGMTLEAVGEFLGLARYDLRRIADGLAAGGALREVDGETLAVWPRELRNPLLCAVFFPGSAVKHPYRELLGRVPNLQSAVATLVSAKHHGADIPVDELRELIVQSDSQNAWRGFADLGKAEASWVLENYSGNIEDIALAALMHAPEDTIIRLLRRAEKEDSSRAWFPKWLLPIVLWFRVDPKTPFEELVHRRKVLADTVRRYLRAGGQRSAGLHALGLAFSPTWETTSRDPGMGGTVTIEEDLFPPNYLQELVSILKGVSEIFHGIESADWQPHLASLFQAWRHPGGVEERTEELKQTLLAFSITLLTIIASFAQGKPALTSKLRALARELNVELSLEPDLLFDLLFPVTANYSLNDRELEQKYVEWNVALNELAAQWANREPAEVAEVLARYEAEAQGIGQMTPRGDSKVCERLAVLTDEPEVWLDTLLAQGVSGALTGPFLERMVAARREGWEQQVERFLSLDPGHAWSAVEAVLRLPSPPAPLLEKAFERLSEVPQLLERLCLRREVPLDTLRTLFCHPRWELALVAAVGEWNSERQGDGRPEIAAEWRSAISRAGIYSDVNLNPSLEYWLGDILAKDPSLAFDWLLARLRSSKRPYSISGKDDPFGVALSNLSHERRLQLVEVLEKDRCPKGFIGLLVGKDRDIFKRVLSSESLRPHHLEPLGFLPDETWTELALLALEAGHETNEVVEASLWRPGAVRSTILGSERGDAWDAVAQALGRLESDPRYQIQELARVGRELAAREREKLSATQRHFALRGFGSDS